MYFKKDSNIKKTLRKFLEIFLQIFIFISSMHRRSNLTPKLYFGGARKGNFGGPLVKLKRLNEFFPEHYWNYNAVYLLSNAPYLNYKSLNILRKNRIPIILNQNGVFYPGWFSGDWKKQNQKMSLAYHLADYVFWQSKFCRVCADEFLGKRKGEGEILYNAVDLKHFYPNGSLIEGEFTFLITGKIENHLNYRIESAIMGLALTIKQGLNVKLIIGGIIENILSIRNLIEKNNLSEKVKFIGPYSQENAPKIYQSANAYVMTKYLDPCPNTVLEAMACGLPILFSNSGGVPELVGKKAGVPLDVKQDWNKIHFPSPENISLGMIEIIKKHNEMSKSARLRAEEKFDIKHWIKNHNNVFMRLLER